VTGTVTHGKRRTGETIVIDVSKGCLKTWEHVRVRRLGNNRRSLAFNTGENHRGKVQRKKFAVAYVALNRWQVWGAGGKASTSIPSGEVVEVPITRDAKNEKVGKKKAKDRKRWVEGGSPGRRKKLGDIGDWVA